VYEDVNDIESGYEANLVRVDVKKYYFGATLFYKIQLLHDKIKNMYLLLTKWGGYGEEGMC
jgi:hypothetical protein